MSVMLPMMTSSFDRQIGYPSFIPATRTPRESGTTSEGDPSRIGMVSPAPEFDYLNDQWTRHLGLEDNYTPPLLQQLFGNTFDGGYKGVGFRAVMP